MRRSLDGNYARNKTGSVSKNTRERIRAALPDECEMHALSHEFLAQKISELFEDAADLQDALTDFVNDADNVSTHNAGTIPSEMCPISISSCAVFGTVRYTCVPLRMAGPQSA